MSYIHVEYFKEKLPFLLARNKLVDSADKLTSELGLKISKTGKNSSIETWKYGNASQAAGQIPINHYQQIQSIYGLVDNDREKDGSMGDQLFREGSVEEFKNWCLANPLQQKNPGEKVKIGTVNGPVNVAETINIEHQSFSYGDSKQDDK